ncbi:DNA repair protein RadC [candidate division WWE3 bacterium]|jgi:DNA repair protein RadC|uniref:DNA repair protein RadC n=1 Tax=candidate division WWE3 bacterium TaxID=2053526 RepID=A0A3A4ZE70_UNCKA|nr:MAG: DNA repair protein RadC [candidate division WWE3 bacterium]
MSYYRIKDLNKDEKPREKILTLGPKALSEEELLALIIRSGGSDESAIELSRRIIKESGGLKNLTTKSIQQLMSIKNINLAKAACIIAGFELGIRSADERTENPRVKRPEDVFHLIKAELYGKSKEYLYLISLNTRNRLISKDIISIGTVNETLMSPREIFRQALSRNAVYIVLAHNHPSQETTPSEEDILATKKTQQIGFLLGIPLIDHLIVCNDKFTSMKSLNQLETKKLSQKGGEL